MQIKFVLFFMLTSIVDACWHQRNVDIQKTAFFITVSVGGGGSAQAPLSLQA